MNKLLAYFLVLLFPVLASAQTLGSPTTDVKAKNVTASGKLTVGNGFECTGAGCPTAPDLSGLLPKTGGTLTGPLTAPGLTSTNGFSCTGPGCPDMASLVLKSGSTMSGALNISIAPVLPPLDANVRHYWSLDETLQASAATDAVGNVLLNPPGVVGNQPTVVSGAAGNARRVGQNANMYLSSTLPTSTRDMLNTGDWTISLWVRRETAVESFALFSVPSPSPGVNQNAGVRFDLENDGRPRIVTSNASVYTYCSQTAGSATAAQKAPIGVWTHVAAAANRTTKQLFLFVNGKLVHTCSDPTIPTAGTAAYVFNSWPAANYNSKDLAVDDIRVASGVRTEAQLTEEMSALAPGATGVPALRMGFGGADKFYVSTIGDTSVGGNFSVLGPSTFTGDIATNGVLRTTDATNGFTPYNSAGTALGRWFPNGNFHIGQTADQGYKLYVSGQGYFTNNLTAPRLYGTGTLGLYSNASGTTSQMQLDASSAQIVSSDSIHFGIDLDNNTPGSRFVWRRNAGIGSVSAADVLAYLTKSGNFHIGYQDTAYPDNGYKLDVNGGVRATALGLGTAPDASGSSLRMANLPVTSAMHALDASTYALWRFNGTTSGTGGVDAGPNGKTLTGGSVPAANNCVEGNCPSYDGGTTSGWKRDDAAFAQMFRDSSWTIEAWVRPTGYKGTIFTTISPQGTSAGNSPAGLVINTTGQIFGGWQTGTNVNTGCTADLANALTLNTYSHVAARRTMGTGVGTSTMALFINGVKVKECAGLTDPTGATSATGVQTGGGWSNTGFDAIFASNNRWQGQIDDLRVSMLARTDADIATSYSASTLVNASDDVLLLSFGSVKLRAIKGGKLSTYYDGIASGLQLPVSAGVPAPNLTYTTEGDVVWDGTNDKLYVYDGAAYKQVGGGGVGAVRNVSASGAVGSSDQTLYCDATSAAVAMTLPSAAANAGREVRIIKTDVSANYCSLTTTGGENVWNAGNSNPSNTTVRSNLLRGGFCTVQSNGTAWWVTAGAACEGL